MYIRQKQHGQEERRLGTNLESIFNCNTAKWNERTRHQVNLNFVVRITTMTIKYFFFKQKET